MRLTNKTILVTGGTSGIGLELGKTLLPNNKVILLGRNINQLLELKGQGFEIIQCDLAKINDIENCAITIENEYPNLDVLFNNAGIQYNYSFINDIINPSKIASEININFIGQILLTQLLIPVLNNSKEALIVNTTSALGIIPKANALVYSATKAAMRNFNFGLKQVLKSSNIEVIELIPPVTSTNMTIGRNENMISPRDLLKIIIPQIEAKKSLVSVKKIKFYKFLASVSSKVAYRLIN